MSKFIRCDKCGKELSMVNAYYDVAVQANFKNPPTIVPREPFYKHYDMCVQCFESFTNSVSKDERS